VNNYDEDTDMIDVDLVKYLVVGKEVAPDTGTPHLQGFVIFKKPMTLANCKEILPTAHWSVKYKNSTPLQAASYCKEDGDFFEWGECPATTTGAIEGGAKTKANYELAWQLAKEGRFEEMDKGVLFRHYSTCKRILQDYQKRAKDLDTVCGVWLVGDPDSGKSFIARNIFGEHGYYDKPANKWFDGYQGAEGEWDEVPEASGPLYKVDTVIVDDVDHVHKVLGHHLKRWGDRYSFPAEQKGTTIQIRPKRIVVTSNYKISEIWAGDSQMIEALEKRYIQYIYTAKWWEYKDPEVIDNRVRPPPGFVPREQGPEMARLRAFYGMMPAHREIQANAAAVAKSLSPPRQVPLIQIIEEAGDLALLDPEPDMSVEEQFLTPCCNRPAEDCCQWEILDNPSEDEDDFALEVLEHMSPSPQSPRRKYTRDDLVRASSQIDGQGPKRNEPLGSSPKIVSAMDLYKARATEEYDSMQTTQEYSRDPTDEDSTDSDEDFFANFVRKVQERNK